jgi:PEP-CTERM motif
VNFMRKPILLPFSKTAALALPLMLMATTANATFIGDQVTINGGPFTFAGNHSTQVVVGNGVEAKGTYLDPNTSITWFMSFDISASSIQLMLTDNHPEKVNQLNVLDGVIGISGLDWQGDPNLPISSATFTANPVTGLGADDLFVYAHAIDLVPDNNKTPVPNPLRPWQWKDGQAVDIKLTVPEPSSLAILSFGLVALAYGMRKRKRE